MKKTIKLLFLFLFLACKKDIEPIVPIDKRPELIKIYSGVYTRTNENFKQVSINVTSNSVDSLTFTISNKFTVPLYENSTIFTYTYPKFYKNKVAIEGTYLNEEVYYIYDFFTRRFSFDKDTLIHTFDHGNSYIEYKKDSSTIPYQNATTSPIYKFIKVKN